LHEFLDVENFTMLS